MRCRDKPVRQGNGKRTTYPTITIRRSSEPQKTIVAALHPSRTAETALKYLKTREDEGLPERQIGCGGEESV
jgi:hypothetical protein